MSIYLPVSGGPNVAIGICDRCKMKAQYSELIPDHNNPALRVHKDCADEFDPYRLPPRKNEDLALKYPRPDEPLE